MTNETSHSTDKGSRKAEMDPQAQEQLIAAVRHNGSVALRTRFEEVEGEVVRHNVYGPLFVYRVKDEAGDVYACGFFLRELIVKFQRSTEAAEQWMASFFFEMMKTKGGKQLPNPPQSEDEAKEIVDKVLVPQCMAAVNEEFAPEQMHVGLAMDEQLGPVLEAGFPAIRDGNNVCALPLHVLLAHYLLNRDPSELLVQGLYKIREEHGAD
ncbi:hypothetical protein [Cohnella caldifontis]|uniref:hypothetical protein n=1 Tax=Cohnella caldifontis TaxID=3027471 RepID=UPI0023EBC28A|nr:hypothetical protein [Cohnella sp. YIM B05605]